MTVPRGSGAGAGRGPGLAGGPGGAGGPAAGQQEEQDDEEEEQRGPGAMDQCVTVERELEKVLQKFSGYGQLCERSLEELIQYAGGLRREILQTESTCRPPRAPLCPGDAAPLLPPARGSPKFGALWAGHPRNLRALWAGNPTQESPGSRDPHREENPDSRDPHPEENLGSRDPNPEKNLGSRDPHPEGSVPGIFPRSPRSFGALLIGNI